MTARRFGLSVLLGLLLTGLLGVPAAQAYHTNFQGTCNAIKTDIGTKLKRTQARSYALVGKDEGYQWGGGCWNNNNVDDAPGDPHEQYTNGEGGDCSGFTYKSWYLRPDISVTGFRIHDQMEKTHGPYAAWDYNAGTGTAVNPIGKASAILMDAFASSYHVAMIYTANVALNADDMIEAKGEDIGTKVLRETYRGNADYLGARRANWQVECYPQCTGNE